MNSSPINCIIGFQPREFFNVPYRGNIPENGAENIEVERNPLLKVVSREN
jgi:hypothetical protein